MNRTLTRRVCISVLASAMVWRPGILRAQVAPVQPIAAPPGLMPAPPMPITKILTNGDRVASTVDASNFAIDGPGWFMLRNPQLPLLWENHVTRIGNFFLDCSGYLLSPDGMRVQGYSDPELSTLGDIVADARGAPANATVGAILSNLKFGSDGRLLVTLSDGTTFVRGQVLLQNFQAPELLTREAYTLYTPTAAAGPLDRPAAPGTAGLGRLLVGWLDETPEPVRLSLFPSADQTGALTEGVLTPTGFPTDLAIRGPGFFLARDTNNSKLFATRAGLFLRDAEGYLITYDGLRVQGYSDGALMRAGDVRIDSAGSPSLPGQTILVAGFTIDSQGLITVTLSNGASFTRGQVLLSVFAHPECLTPAIHGLYAGVVKAQPQPTTLSPIRIGVLELINVPEDLLALRHTLSFFAQERIVYDGISTHLAPGGAGFFILRSLNDGSQYATRHGAFHLDPEGYLINSEALRVQGYADPGLTILGDLRIDEGGSAAPVSSLRVGSDGVLHETLTDGTVLSRGQVLLQEFAAPFLLRRHGPTLYTNLAAAVPLPQPVAPGSDGLGAIESGFLEIPYPPEELTLPSRNGIRLHITGEPLCGWTIQASTDLGRWTNLAQVTNSPDEMEFTDTNSISLGQRFYRVHIDDVPTGLPRRLPDEIW